MRKNIIFSLLILTLIALPLLAACAGEEETESTTTTSTTSEETEVEETEVEETEVIELKMATGLPSMSAVSQLQQEWIDKIEEQSEGRVQITLYTDGSLLAESEILRGVQTGIADIGWHNIGDDTGVWDLNSMLLLPFLGWQSWSQASALVNELVSADSSIPEFREEYENAGLFIYEARMSPPTQIETTDDPVRVPDDVVGMKFYAGGDIGTIIQQAGGTPVDLSPQDWFMSVETGVLHGMCVHFAIVGALGLTELFDYYTIVGEGGLSMSPILTFFNADTWNSLPSDIQQIFLDLEPWLFAETEVADLADIQTAMDVAEEMGKTFLELTPAEIELWAAIALPLHDDWVAAAEANGLAGEELYEGLVQLIEEYPDPAE